MYILLFGEVGLYNDNKDTNPNFVLRNNSTFGEKVMDSAEKRYQTAIAHKVTVCLSINRNEF